MPRDTVAGSPPASSPIAIPLSASAACAAQLGLARSRRARGFGVNHLGFAAAMSVLKREELEDSPLADLHAIASELGLEGFRAKRKPELIAAILEASGGEAGVKDA